MRVFLYLAALVAMLALAGCDAGGGPSKDAGVDADGDLGDGGDGDTGDTDGEDALLFELELVESTGANGGGAAAFAWVANPEVGDGAWVPTLTAGDCVYNTPEAPGFCDPACDPGQVCRADDTCGPPITRVSAGTISVTGLTVGLTLRPVEPYLYYESVWSPEPADGGPPGDGDLFSGGDRVTATAAGDTVPAFTVSTTGVDAMETDLPCPLELAPGADLEVTWTPGTGGDDRVVFALQSGNHGMQFSSVTCEVADTGFLRVDATLIDAFLTDFHPVLLWILRREHEGAVAAGPVDVHLRAVSRVACYQ